MGPKKNGSGALITIFVEASFDYSHFLPENDQCFPLHGHTSLVNLEITGKLLPNGMVMDFAEAKKVLREIISLLDHKLVTNKANVKSMVGGKIYISYKDFEFCLPAAQVFLLEWDGTSESICIVLAKRLLEKMPENVESIRLSITEGLRKGTVVDLNRHGGTSQLHKF